MPTNPGIHFGYIRLLSAAKQHQKAYQRSIKTIDMIEKIEKDAAALEKKDTDLPEEAQEERKQNALIKKRLINDLNGFALGDMDERDAALLNKGGLNLDECKRLVKSLKKAHQEFPLAEQITQRLAVELARTGEDGIKEAVDLLEAAKEKALSDESREALVNLIGDLRTEQKKAGPRAEAIRLVQEAYNSAQELNKPESTPRTPDQVREVLVRAIADTERGITIAREIGEKDLVKQAEPLLKQLRNVLDNFNRRS
jgi:hypothetical protein